jgi:leader peptidase (prepilin peptidase) / N-methyltransferase
MLEAILAFLAGLLIGSFLNVCVYRLPRDLSVVRPRSHCPECEKQIAWYDNIPLVSYIRLKARCRHCGARIPWRYPAVELLTGLLFFLIVFALGPGLMAVKLCLFCALMVGMMFTDLEERILPDEFTLGGTVVGLALAWFVPVNDIIAHLLLFRYAKVWDLRWFSLAESVAGAAIPALLLWFGGYLFEKLRGKEGMGLGDVKMMAMMGSFFGVSASLLILILGALAGSLIGYTYIKITKQEPDSYQLPFGTFLAAAGIFVALQGEKVLHWYASLL